MIFKEKREKIKEIKSQNRLFNARLLDLSEKRYVHSMRYEDSLILDDGKAYVNVDLTKIESPFSVFSYDKRIDPEIYDYIDSQVYYLRAAVPVVINFDDGGKYTQEMKDKIKKNVVRHYSLEYEDRRLEHRKSMIFGFILLITGLFFLTFHFLSLTVFSRFDSDTRILEELSLILSWMFVWQSVDTFFISGHTKRVDIYNSGQLALAEVTFGPPKL